MRPALRGDAMECTCREPGDYPSSLSQRGMIPCDWCNHARLTPGGREALARGCTCALVVGPMGESVSIIDIKCGGVPEVT